MSSSVSHSLLNSIEKEDRKSDLPLMRNSHNLSTFEASSRPSFQNQIITSGYYKESVSNALAYALNLHQEDRSTSNRSASMNPDRQKFSNILDANKSLYKQYEER